jgi:hypothetical protein
MDFDSPYEVLTELNLKIIPDKNAENIAVLKEGETVNREEAYNDLELSKTWYKVKTKDNKEGWCFSEKLQKIQAVQNDAGIYTIHNNSSFIGNIVKIAIIVILVIILGPSIMKQIKSILPIDLPIKISLSMVDYDKAGRDFTALISSNPSLTISEFQNELKEMGMSSKDFFILLKNDPSVYEFTQYISLDMAKDEMKKMNIDVKNLKRALEE